MNERKPEIKELSFEYQEIEIVETFIDESGRTCERKRLASLQTGEVSKQDEAKEDD